MKRFAFPLRPVAILRAHHEMRAREAFAAAVHAFVVAEQALAAARERVRNAAHALTAGRATRFSGQREAEAVAAFRRECQVEGEAEQALALAGEAMSARRVAYVEAHRKLEVVRRLEGRARAAHRRDALREEQAEYDEFATRRFNRGRPGRA